MDLNKIKLIVWDLDDTFWHGTISEGPVSMNPEHCDFVRRLVDRGVMNSICSKNDFDTVRTRLETEGLWDYFVFPSIDWSPKAKRIADIIDHMSLRPVNVLFIDDNPLNLNEARFYIPDLNVLDVRDIAGILAQAATAGKDDSRHKHLSQYHQLEKKVEASTHFDSTDEFLIQSRIQVDVNHDCLPHLDRISEMVLRTNQLNFTKLRSSADELRRVLADPVYQCGVVSAHDIYGDYGIVGFYALDTRDCSLLHFLFSCRTMGMGIEQYIYEQLCFPSLVINGDVSVTLEKVHKAHWINTGDQQPEATAACESASTDSKLRILLKGPCDMDSVLPYLSGNRNCDIRTEFNFIDARGVAVTAMNHTQMIVQGRTLPSDVRNALLRDAPFLDPAVFRTDMADPGYDIVFLSMLPDCHEGVYCHRHNGGMISFSSCNYDFTDTALWDSIIDGQITNHNYRFKREDLERFSRDFEFVGPLPTDRIIDNVRYIRDRVLAPGTRLVLILGSEIECENPTSDEFARHAPRHREVNHALKAAFAAHENVAFINITDLLTGPDDLKGCTNHFCRSVYYQLACAISGHTAACSGSTKVRVVSPLRARLRRLLRRITSRLK